LEDHPGTGKTTFAKALALSIDVQFKRVQFTPDLLPSDILGVSIFDQHDKAFHFHEGPIFTNILLVDEINRASPRTQSALLEAMAESQVSIDGKLRPLEYPFFVIATQNPVESRGTYPLPEAEMDRFALQFSLGYVSPEEEVEILTDQTDVHPIEKITSCVSIDDILDMKRHMKKIRVSEELKRYIVDIVGATRTAQGVQLGASPRASLSLMHSAKALAMFDGGEFLTPEHIQEIAIQVIAHRMVMDPQARFSGRTAELVVEDILKAIPAPG
jgi:MoxR-like ATPase